MTDNTEIVVHPVQVQRHPHHGPQCPAIVTLRAYEVYRHIYGEQSALVTGSCRGGFGVTELLAFLYARSFPKEEWKQRAAEAFKGMRGM